MARTSIEIDEKLIKKTIALTGAKSKREAVDAAIRRLVEKGIVYVEQIDRNLASR